jgi:hypothetical protein
MAKRSFLRDGSCNKKTKGSNWIGANDVLKHTRARHAHSASGQPTEVTPMLSGILIYRHVHEGDSQMHRYDSMTGFVNDSVTQSAMFDAL